MKSSSRLNSKKYHQGYYKAINPQKYLGNANNIQYLSSWERTLMRKFDLSNDILAWGSEEIVIPYLSPIDNKMHKYYMDFIIVTGPKECPQITLIEVKPEAQKYPPKKQGKRKDRYLYEVKTYAVNQAKWKAAEAYCQKKGWKFYVMTEKDIFNKLGK